MTFHTQPEEKTVLQLRKHWFILLKMTLPSVLMGVVPIFILAYVISAGLIPLSGIFALPAFWLFSASFWLLIWGLVFATAWTDYFLDVWIVTDRRIINIDQIGFFNREITTTRMERVQDATTRQTGIIQTLLNYGAIGIQTASEDASDLMIEGIPDPTGVRNTIMRYMDMYTERHMEETSEREEGVYHHVHQE